MFARPLSSAISITMLAVLTACVAAPVREERVVYRDVPAPAPVARPVPVYAEYGRVERVGAIELSRRPSGAGAVLGAVIGGVIGNRFGAGTGRALATGVGAVGGAVAGNAIESRQLRDDEVFRVTVRFDNGSLRDFDFQRIDDLRAGDRVKFEGGQLHRI